MLASKLFTPSNSFQLIHLVKEQLVVKKPETNAFLKS
jgi:hypothetical protein